MHPGPYRPEASGCQHQRSKARPLWQTHPRPDRRKAAVDDPSTLVSLRPLSLVFTGAAAILITDHVPEDVLSTIGLSPDWTDLAAAAIAAVIVTAVVGTSLWRAVIYASLNRKAAPTGVLAGLWLGSGMVLGQLASVDVSFRIDWLPDYPWVYLVLVAIAIAYTWWGSQTARIWVERWPGRRIAPIMLLNLIGAGLLLAVALGWWTNLGITFSSRSLLDVIALNRFATEGLLTDSAGPYEQALTLISTLTPFWVTLILAPLAWLAVTVLLLLSLTAWAIPPGAHARPWTTRFGGKSRAQPVDLLPLRGVLMTAVLGGAVALVGILFVKSLMEPSAVRLGGNPDGFLDIMIYSAGSEAAIAAGTLVAAIVVSAITGRYRLLTAVATAAIAAWAGLAAAFLVSLTEGCHGPLNLFRSTCSLNPEAALLLARADVTLSLAIAPIAAFIGAGLVSGIHRLLRIPTRRWVRDWSYSRLFAGQTVRTWGVLIVCAPLAGLGIVAEAATWSGSDSGSSGTQVAELIAEDDSILSPETQAIQIYSWHYYGGLDLVDRLSTTLLAYAEFWAEVGEEAENNPQGYVDVDIDQLETMCTDLSSEADDAQRYFAIPDAEAQESWNETIDLIDVGARTCLQAAEDRDQYMFVDATTLITSAVPYFETAVNRLDEFDRPD